jgi:hypothetical protein
LGDAFARGDTQRRAWDARWDMDVAVSWRDCRRRRSIVSSEPSELSGVWYAPPREPVRFGQALLMVASHGYIALQFYYFYQHVASWF